MGNAKYLLSHTNLQFFRKSMLIFCQPMSRTANRNLLRNGKKIRSCWQTRMACKQRKLVGTFRFTRNVIFLLAFLCLGSMFKVILEKRVLFTSSSFSKKTAGASKNFHSVHSPAVIRANKVLVEGSWTFIFPLLCGTSWTQLEENNLEIYVTPRMPTLYPRILVMSQQGDHPWWSPAISLTLSKKKIQLPSICKIGFPRGWKILHRDWSKFKLDESQRRFLTDFLRNGYF